MMKTKVRKTANILIRVAIVVLTLVFIYYQIFNRKNYQEIIDYFPTVTSNANFYFLLSLVLLLFPLNLFLEIWKWKYLIKRLEKVSYWNATKAILTGYSVSMFLPNRVGEYFGRIYVLKSAGRIRAILVTVLGSMAQLLTTLLFGMIALSLILPEFIDLTDQTNRWLYSGILFFILLFIVVSVFAYLNFSSFTGVVKRISGHKLARINKYTIVFSWYSSKKLAVVLVASMLRYFIFSFQFFLLLHVFLVPIAYFNAMIIISVVYLLMTVIPTIALTELGVRGSVSLFVFSQYFEKMNLWNDQLGLGVVSAAMVLWLINLAFPALLGITFVNSLRFFRNNKNDSH